MKTLTCVHLKMVYDILEYDERFEPGSEMTYILCENCLILEKVPSNMDLM